MKKHIVICLLFLGLQAKAQIETTDFTEVTGSSFTMGNSSYTRESPVRTITVSTFYMTKNAVTNAQYASFLNQYGSQTVKAGEYAGKTLFVTDSWGIANDNGTWKAATGYENYPAIKITWYGANEFCKYYNGRLPTEAEWEYAAKGGKNKNAFTYSGSNTATAVAWFYDNSGHTNKAVGTKTANSIGLFDMSGNVYQWCSDWFGRYNDVNTSGGTDTSGPETGVSKVIRGGYRSLGTTDLHLTHRESLSPDESANFVGFRMVKSTLTTVASDYLNEIKVYPNPVTDILRIDAPDEIKNVEIIDVNGRKIFISTGNKKEFQLKDYAAGIYFVKIDTSSKTEIQKIRIENN
ncbi:MAG TPA: SUMF1/EgtB/PvdO family nonheme iron enzyme [Paludibacter sp.]|nr:SUMF1/EgtB/PvdO family nonheme iron enzyme [Paludibacter sp.]